MTIEVYHTPQYFADLLGVTRRALMRYIKKYGVPYIRLSLHEIRIPQSSIDDFLAKQRRYYVPNKPKPDAVPTTSGVVTTPPQ